MGANETAWKVELLSRFQLTTFVEAVRLLEEGIATAMDIDIAMRAGAGLTVGPFQWADKTGLDVIAQQLKEMEGTFGERFKPPVSLLEKIARGQLGISSGQGYLVYPGSAPL